MKGKGVFQIITGLFVSGLSYYLNNKNGNQKFLLFLIAGGIFFAYGILKLIFYILIRPKSEKNEKVKKIKEEKINHNTNFDFKIKHVNPENITELKNNDSPFHKHHETIIACHSCNTKHYSNANYCQFCGTRLRK